MPKVVYNNCYGGFGLSNEAMDRLIELGYEGLTPNPNYNSQEPSIYTNMKYYGDYDIPRHDPLLIQVVQELGKKASDWAADLQIADVEGLYSIEEYDGLETVVEPANVDWQYADNPY